MKTPEINDSTTTDMDVLFDELTNLKDRAKEKALNATALQLSKNDNVTETAAANSDVLDEKSSVVKADHDVFAGTHSIGVAQDTVVSSKTTDTVNHTCFVSCFVCSTLKCFVFSKVGCN